VCCGVLQCVAVCRAFCALLKEKGQTLTEKETMIGTLQVCCSVLQCVAMCRALCARLKEKGHTPTEETRIGVCVRE